MPHRAAPVSAVRASAVAAALAAIAIGIAGCTSGGTIVNPIVRDSPLPIMLPSPGSSASARIVESSDAVLQEHLLTLSDLPTGWKQGPGAAIAGDSTCTAISDPAYNRLPLHAEAEFTSGSGLEGLTEILAYGSTPEVDAAWTSYVQAMASCGRLTMRLAGQTLQLTLTQVRFPRTGDVMDAREGVNAQGRKASFYFVVTRKGDLVEAVTYSGWGTASMSEIQRFVEGAAVATDDIT